jgi:hypothetical protein
MRTFTLRHVTSLFKLTTLFIVPHGEDTMHQVKLMERKCPNYLK